MASADLAGLGDKTGPAVTFHWTVPSIVPSLIPWLALLGLLLVRANRCASAWWIWVPLGALALFTTFLAHALDWLPSPLNQVFSDLLLLLGFGTAATWLLAEWLGPRHRALTFFGILLVGAVFSFIAYVFSQDLTGMDAEIVGTGMIGALAVGVFALSLTLGGWVCRKRYRPVRLCLFTLLFMAGFWSLIAAPFLVFALIAARGRVSVGADFLVPLAGIILVSFLAVFPFLLLSFGNGFYRARLGRLLKLGRAPALPPVIDPAAAALRAAAE